MILRSKNRQAALIEENQIRRASGIPLEGGVSQGLVQMAMATQEEVEQ
jgi:hypothetical protein